MEEEPRSIPMTRQADLSRMPDSRIVRPIRWDPSAMVNCSILTSNPSPSTVFEEGDIVWIVGEHEKVVQLSEGKTVNN